MAPIFGFHWAVEDAGGAASQVKIDLARAGGDEGRAAVQWLAAYNGSDVAAQAAIRDGLRRASPQASLTDQFQVAVALEDGDPTGQGRESRDRG